MIDNYKQIKQSFKGSKKESDGTGWLCPKKLPSDLENIESSSHLSFKLKQTSIAVFPQQDEFYEPSVEQDCSKIQLNVSVVT